MKMRFSNRRVIQILHVCGFVALFLSFPTHYPVLHKADMIVLLAGSHKERAPAAAYLFRNGYASRVVLTNDGVFSSWSQKYMRNLYQIEWAEEDLVAMGVPRDCIQKLPFIRAGTIYDVLAVKDYATDEKAGSMIIVTSKYHMPRALWTFKHVFAGSSWEIMAYPANFSVPGLKVRAVEQVKRAGYRIVYGLLGRIPERGGQ